MNAMRNYPPEPRPGYLLKCIKAFGELPTTNLIGRGSPLIIDIVVLRKSGASCTMPSGLARFTFDPIRSELACRTLDPIRSELVCRTLDPIVAGGDGYERPTSRTTFTASAHERARLKSPKRAWSMGSRIAYFLYFSGLSQSRCGGEFRCIYFYLYQIFNYAVAGICGAERIA